MNYQKHYDLLCERAKNRVNKGYTEKHHIIPRCLGGTDEKENLVRLTPEEHYVAHQLLAKMHPENQKLVYALSRMTSGRPSNKRYGWVKRKWQEVCKQRKGEKNGSYGRRWYHNPETKEVMKCFPEEVPEGFVKGRSAFSYVEKQCEICGASFLVSKRNQRRKTCSGVCSRKLNYTGFENKDFIRKKILDNVSYLEKQCEICGVRFLVPTTNQKRKTCSEECSYELMSNKSKKNNKELYDYSLILKIYKEKKRTGKGYWSLAQKYNVNKWSIYDYIKRYKAQLEKDTNGK